MPNRSYKVNIVDMVVCVCVCACIAYQLLIGIHTHTHTQYIYNWCMWRYTVKKKGHFARLTLPMIMLEQLRSNVNKSKLR